MPSYDYRCDTCGTTTEERRPMTERDAISLCPTCDVPVRRLVSVPAMVQFDDGGTRNHNKIKMWSIQDRMNAEYGDNP